MNFKKLILSTAIPVFGLFIFAAGFRYSGDLNQLEGNAERGKPLYERYCSTCHGLDGKGEGPAAVYLFPKPRDFSRGIFKFQSTPVGSLPADQDLHRTIQKGMPGSAMPAWDRFTDQDQSGLVEYIKTFSDRFKTEKPMDVLTVGTEPQSTLQMMKEGKAIYALMGCWTCHGRTGVGDGPSASNLKDDLERPIRPYNFTRAGAYKGGGTPQDIYRTFSTGIGGTPMPGYGEDALTFTKEAYPDLTNLEVQYSQSEIEEVKSYVTQLSTEAQLNSMSAAERKALSVARRWALVYYVLSLSNPTKTQVTYTTTDHPVQSVLVPSVAQFADPSASQWGEIKGVELALASLWQRDTPTDRVMVKSVNDGQAIAFRLEWEDPTKDDNALYNAKFGDAAAVQFPLDPAAEPFFAMGDTTLVVNIWHWKSWWEKDLQAYSGVNSAFQKNATDFYLFDVAGGSRAEYFVSKDSAKALSMTWNAGWGSGNPLSAQARNSSVEDLNAKGFGTLTSQPADEQNVRGKGVWRNGRWTVAFTRSLQVTGKNDVLLKAGSSIPVAFAVWDGSLGDRNGQKMVTNWYKLTVGGK